MVERIVRVVVERSCGSHRDGCTRGQRRRCADIHAAAFHLGDGQRVAITIDIIGKNSTPGRNIQDRILVSGVVCPLRTSRTGTTVDQRPAVASTGISRDRSAGFIELPISQQSGLWC
ncbi:hypothetical protein Pla22_28890 [Rubripirellula amarantea]|uniref:Uncharacterized protein n=1 Tax=Rubripirellula amarantea TaxID=2527999 RepID=A0A5C5WJ33_9BACT|nr:hypothetical protein Pla22_28890 [Rubripirellula amarantea]